MGIPFKPPPNVLAYALITINKDGRAQQRTHNLHKARRLLDLKTSLDINDNDVTDDSPPDWLVCPTCGKTMRIVDVFDSAHVPPHTTHRGRDPP